MSKHLFQFHREYETIIIPQSGTLISECAHRFYHIPGVLLSHPAVAHVRRNPENLFRCHLPTVTTVSLNSVNNARSFQTICHNFVKSLDCCCYVTDLLPHLMTMWWLCFKQSTFTHNSHSIVYCTYCSCVNLLGKNPRCCCLSIQFMSDIKMWRADWNFNCDDGLKFDIWSNCNRCVSPSSAFSSGVSVF